LVLVLVPAPVPVPVQAPVLAPILVPEPDNIYHSFQKQKRIAQHEAAYVPESWPFILDFSTFYFYPDQNPVSDPEL
jgi:hypothetical protein